MKTFYVKSFLCVLSMLSGVLSLNSYAAANDKDNKPYNKDEDSSLERIQKEKILKVCSDAGFLPFEMKTQKGDWIGFDVDMMTEFSKSISVELKMVQIAFDGIIPALLTKKCDMIAAGLTVTPERKKMIAFSDTTFTSGLSVALKNTHKNKSLYKDLTSLDNENNIIAVKTGYTSDIYLSKTLKHAKKIIIRFDQDADLVLAVMQGRATAFVSDTTYVDLMDKANKDKFIILPTKVVAEKFSVAARKDDKTLLKSFNSFLEKWRNDGGYDKSKKFYFEEQGWRSQVAN